MKSALGALVQISLLALMCFASVSFHSGDLSLAEMVATRAAVYFIDVKSPLALIYPSPGPLDVLLL